MIRGLQITLRGDELSRRIGEQIQRHETTIRALDERIGRRSGDLPFDVRPEDDFKTLGDLENERQLWRDRVAQLTLLRDNLSGEEVYALSRADLRLSELISPGFADGTTSNENWIADTRTAPVDGLKVTISGDELRTLLDRRIDAHGKRAERWRREQARTPEEQTEEEPLLPDEMCGNEAERHEWRVEVLTFIRDHIDASLVYRLGEADLAFGEVLPAKPGSLEQAEYEERTSVGFHLEQLSKKVGGMFPTAFMAAQQREKDCEN